MDVNKLPETQCSADKTEVMVIGLRAQLAKFNLSSVTVAGVDVPIQTNPVRNLGVMFDSSMTMSAQVAQPSANYHFNNISRARKMLTTEAAKLTVHTLVTCRLDYCNSLLISVNKSLISKLQNVQRTSARVMSSAR